MSKLPGKTAGQSKPPFRKGDIVKPVKGGHTMTVEEAKKQETIWTVKASYTALPSEAKVTAIYNAKDLKLAKIAAPI